MELLYPRCAGLDVHKDTVVACVRVVEAGRTEARTETRKFGTTTKELTALGDWLEGEGVTHAVMEATGVYWKPVWHIVSASVELVLANAGHLRNVPGRKSDVADAAWLASLLAHGLVRPSFVPPEPIGELRAWTRTRKQLVREQARHSQRMQAVLEDANIKLASVISNVMGTSGRLMIEALVAGETDPEGLVAFASPRLKATREELVESLRGRVTAHHRLELKLHLGLYDALQAAIDEIDGHIEEDLRPFREAEKRLTQIPGIGEVAAAAIISEIGVDMKRFATAGHLVSWCGLCPQMDESAGKRRSTRLRKGAPWLKTLLVQCAWAATRKKNSYYRAQYYRIRTRRGGKKAVVAVAASILTAIWHMLSKGIDFVDLGPTYFDRRDESKVVKRLTRRLADLGYVVELHTAA
jgi:transposase